MAPSLQSLRNLRHLSINVFNSIWGFGGLHSFEGVVIDFVSGHRECERGSLRNFTLRCWDVYDENLLSPSVLGNILSGLAPSPCLESVNIQFPMDDLTLERLGKFLSRCGKLNDIHLDIRNFNQIGYERGAMNAFTSSILLTPSLSKLAFPIDMKAGRLGEFEKHLQQRSPTKPIVDLLLRAGTDARLFDDLKAFLGRQKSVNSLEIDVGSCTRSFSPHANEFFNWFAANQPPNLKSLTISGFGSEDDPCFCYTDTESNMAHQDIRRCYPTLEKMLSTCRYLERMYIFHVGITDRETGVMERVPVSRQKNGLGVIDFQIRLRKRPLV
ncbi:hypothetical protein BC829DRAFT_387632 [Chytridium lagenaria]|nr:hypothetical protein BC829DRAFT_387632 [Chytridium lagenaria]